MDGEKGIQRMAVIKKICWDGFMQFGVLSGDEVMRVVQLEIDF